MTKQKPKEEATPMAEKATRAPAISPWEQVVRLWIDKSDVAEVAQRLERELAKQGIQTVAEVVTMPIRGLDLAARAALRADAQALQAAAAQVKEDTK